MTKLTQAIRKDETIQHLLHLDASRSPQTIAKVIGLRKPLDE